MLFNVAAKVQQLVGGRTQLDADVLVLERLYENGVLHQCEAMPNTFGVKEYGGIKIAVVRVFGATAIQQALARVEHKRQFDVKFPAGLLHREQLVAVETDMVRSILRANKIES
jgi:hypothetical protein